MSEPDMVKELLTRGYKKYFSSLKSQMASEPLLSQKSQAHAPLADYGPASTISLTSIVLGTELKHAGLSFQVIDDDNVQGQYADFFRRELKNFSVVAISTTYTVKIESIIKLLELIRSLDQDIPILLGGQGILAWRMQYEDPALLYRQFSAATALFFGEAEGQFPGVVRSLIKKQKSNTNGLPEIIENKETLQLEQAHIPDWSLLREYNFNDGAIARHGHPRVASLEEGRGCSFKCKFCSYPLYSSFRRKSKERLVAELKAIHAEGFEKAAFVGAEFLMPLAHSKGVFEAIAEAQIPLDIWAYARLDIISHNPWLADLMQKARFTQILFGMESGDREVLRAMGKNYDPEKMAEGAKLLRERNIAVHASLLLGYPGETEKSLANTVAVLKECNFEHVAMHVLDVIHGSRLWNQRAEYQLQLDDSGYWAHPTMELAQMPAHVKKMFVDVHANTESSINTITQNFSYLFFRGQAPWPRLHASSKTLQKIICNEWEEQDAELRDKKRIQQWQQLKQEIDFVPAQFL